jgi:hypothetical protein
MPAEHVHQGEKAEDNSLFASRTYRHCARGEAEAAGIARQGKTANICIPMHL